MNYGELYDVSLQLLKAAEGFEYGDKGQNNADANNTWQICSRSRLIQKLQEHFNKCLIVLRTEGCANIIAFCKFVSEKSKLVEANDYDNIYEKAKENYNESLPSFICSYYFMSSNRILPFVCTCSSIFVELLKVIQSAVMGN